MKEQQSKLCAYCKRPFSNRKKWSRRNVWEKVLYCSERCRRSR